MADLNEKLRGFFAVTKSSGNQISVYRVEADGGQDGGPVIKKVAKRGVEQIGVGEQLPKVPGSPYVGISPRGLAHCFSRDESCLDSALFRTSPIVGLFLDQAEALMCFRSDDGQPCDDRWSRQTNEVTKAIGDNHPVFFMDYRTHRTGSLPVSR